MLDRVKLLKTYPGKKELRSKTVFRLQYRQEEGSGVKLTPGPDEIKGPRRNQGAGWPERTILNSYFYYWNKDLFLMCY